MPERKAGNGSTTHFSFEATATRLGIPTENWEHPIVREFIELLNRAQQLQMDFSVADVKNSVWLSGKPSEERIQHAHDTGAMVPALADRYISAELLLRATIEILKDGFRGNPVGVGYLKNKIDVAIARYGLVVTREQPQSRTTNTPALDKP